MREFGLSRNKALIKSLISLVYSQHEKQYQEQRNKFQILLYEQLTVNLFPDGERHTAAATSFLAWFEKFEQKKRQWVIYYRKDYDNAAVSTSHNESFHALIKGRLRSGTSTNQKKNFYKKIDMITLVTELNYAYEDILQSFEQFNRKFEVYEQPIHPMIGFLFEYFERLPRELCVQVCPNKTTRNFKNIPRKELEILLELQKLVLFAIKVEKKHKNMLFLDFDLCQICPSSKPEFKGLTLIKVPKTNMQSKYAINCRTLSKIKQFQLKTVEDCTFCTVKLFEGIPCWHYLFKIATFTQSEFETNAKTIERFVATLLKKNNKTKQSN